MEDEHNENGSGNDVQTRCACCRRDLQLGVDAIAVEAGVMGPRGFVPLGKVEFFCGDECLHGNGDDGQRERLPRRIP